METSHCTCSFDVHLTCFYMSWLQSPPGDIAYVGHYYECVATSHQGGLRTLQPTDVCSVYILYILWHRWYLCIVWSYLLASPRTEGPLVFCDHLGVWVSCSAKPNRSSYVSGQFKPLTTLLCVRWAGLAQDSTFNLDKRKRSITVAVIWKYNLAAILDVQSLQSTKFIAKSLWISEYQQWNMKRHYREVMKMCNTKCDKCGIYSVKI